MRLSSAAALAFALAFAGCQNIKPNETPAKKQEPLTKTQKVPRADFNRVAAELALPIFWSEDADGDQELDPAELSVFWGLAPEAKLDAYVAGGAFTPELEKTYAQIVAVKEKGHKTEGLDPAEAKRREVVLKELSQGRPTMVSSKFTGTSPEDAAILKNVLDAARVIEKIHLEQIGAAKLVPEIPADHPASRMLFFRNQGPWCVAPATEQDPDCNAIPSKPKKISGLYPESLQADEKFCEKLAARKDHETLMGHFAVVKDDGQGNLTAVPYNVAYKADMESISRSLKAAADAITSEGEAAFKAYLLAASQSFLDNNWEPADEAWAKMNVHNSKWYLRIGPDETYFEPCNTKAGFHVSFARINEGSLAWQQKLDPVKDEMEQILAKLAGPPYKARKVSFHLPDFLDIVLNAGDARSPHGATIGQSLPNWGKVANEGRGRTVAMVNFYTDPDSMAAARAQAESMLCADLMASYSDDKDALVMGTVLHEAAHNLGPSHEYKVKGKTAEQAFGGPLASTMEELKAQSAALFFTEWLRDKGLVTPDAATRAHVRDLTWAFGHISRGMYTATGEPKPYSQLAAVQVNFLRKEGALLWKPEEMAANKTDKGCVSLEMSKLGASIERLMRVVASIKSRGDKAGAEALRKELVDTDDGLLKVITERMLRSPKSSFVYSIEL